MFTLSTEQLDQGAAYLASCAAPNGEISGGYSWRKLAEITGEDPKKLSSGIVMFQELRQAGRLVDLPCIPGTFGHSIFKIVEA